MSYIYYGYIQSVDTKKHLGHFFIADEFFDCNQAILSLGGEGCSRSAVLAILILNSIR